MRARGGGPPGIERGPAGGLAENSTRASSNAREPNPSRGRSQPGRATKRPSPAQIQAANAFLAPARPAGGPPLPQDNVDDLYADGAP
jgi:hypothetical protein